MADRYDERYRSDRYRDDRGIMDRAGDEVRSWFGDDEAARRRRMDEEYGRDRDYGHRMGFDYERRPYRDWSERGHGHAGFERGWPSDAAQGRSSERWGGDRWSSDWDRPPLTERIHTEGRTGYYSYNEPTRHWGPSRYPTPSAGFGAGAGGYGTDNMGTTGSGEHNRAAGYGMTSFGVTYPQRQYTGHGPRGYQRSDDRIREDVCDRLTDDPWVDASEVEVTVRGGEVTLSGSVRDRSDKRRSEDIIEGISGVREVHNNLRVSSGGDAGTRPQATTGTAPATTTRR